MMFDNELSPEEIAMNDFDGFVSNKFDSNCDVLDIGCGCGEFLYRLFHKHDIRKLCGIDIAAKSEIEKDICGSSHAFGNSNLYSALKQKRHHQQDLELFDYYALYVKYELEIQPLEEEAFQMQFDLRFAKEFSFNKFANKRYNLIIATRIIHYTSIESPEVFIAECCQILKEGGYLYITYPTDIDTKDNDRRKITKAGFVQIIQGIPTLRIERLSEADGIITFYGTKHST